MLPCSAEQDFYFLTFRFFDLSTSSGNQGFQQIELIIIHFIYRELQLLVKNVVIEIDKEIHSYHKKKKKSI